MQIDKTTYKIKENNWYKTETAKTQIVLATSLRKESYHITRLLHKDFGKTKKWNTYTISRCGTVYQHYDDKYYSDFLGIKEVNKQSISIVLENMGYLFQTSDDNYINWLNEICSKENVCEKNWLGYDYWEIFTNLQLENNVKLCKLLCEKHNIPKICIDFRHYHKDIFKFKGIVFQSNYIENSCDFNPLFDIENFNKLLLKK